MSDYKDLPEFSEENEEPEIWDEHRWEEFMREADKRTDKFSSLFEEYIDHPDRERIIAREMGWDHMLDRMEQEDDASDELEEEFFVDEFDEGEEWKYATGYDVPTQFDDVENFPLYQKAYQFTLHSIRLVEEKLKEVNDEAVNAFASSVIIPPAKIAGAFGFGFELESLGGNIANNKRGLSAANRVLSALQDLRDKEILDQETFQEYYTLGKEVRDELAIYIVELRERFQRGIP